MAFEAAKRSGTKAIIALYGGSGAGKSLSALLMARGLVGPNGNIYMADTESGRGAIYSDDSRIGGYMIDNIEAPYTSDKYSEKVNDAVAHSKASGVPGCLIIDSASHEWEGIGGVVNAAETTAENRAKKSGYPWNGTVPFGDWKTPKAAHKRMMLNVLGAPIHVIFCLRAQYKSHQVEKKDYAKYGIQSNTKTTVFRDDFQTPIQDANFIFEMIIHAELRANTPTNPDAAGRPIVTKCPDNLLHAFPNGERISAKTGEIIAEWCDGGGIETVSDEDTKAGAEAAAKSGTEAYAAHFKGLQREQQVYLTGKVIPHPSGIGEQTIHELCKEISKANDGKEEY